ncbi:hypothetical protein LZ198_14705 [Myxococcus sp. K15C18031901]|uniref:hypothetical protein n=1 Tax=Myxococcus dinghuensis TaxID=2906761 RepID=UPI0020A7B9E6|nr:hypothetical protein [Myxococcus dinghuensis]MCP3100124.1 hypothetical protein [Myxococcus dinghuensis]
MDSVYVVSLKGSNELLLLAEPGLTEGNNVTFDKNGRQASYLEPRFAADAREINFESDELADLQRAAYAAYWARHESDAIQDGKIKKLWMLAKQHPVRQGEDRQGGTFLPMDVYTLGQLTQLLWDWLDRAVDEDVVGEIGGFGRAVWLRSFVPEADTRVPIPFGIHADTRALGVVRFLAFVSRCGGADHVRARWNSGEATLISEDGTQAFSTVPFFYWSPSH